MDNRIVKHCTDISETLIAMGAENVVRPDNITDSFCAVVGILESAIGSEAKKARQAGDETTALEYDAKLRRINAAWKGYMSTH